jgi:hypothetical protein
MHQPAKRRGQNSCNNWRVHQRVRSTHVAGDGDWESIVRMRIVYIKQSYTTIHNHLEPWGSAKLHMQMDHRRHHHRAWGLQTATPNTGSMQRRSPQRCPSLAVFRIPLSIEIKPEKLTTPHAAHEDASSPTSPASKGVFRRSDIPIKAADAFGGWHGERK